MLAPDHTPSTVIFSSPLREEGERVTAFLRAFLDNAHEDLRKIKIEPYVAHNHSHTLKLTYPATGKWADEARTLYLNTAMLLLQQHPMVNHEAVWQQAQEGGQPPLRFVHDTQPPMKPLVLSDGSTVEMEPNQTALYVTLDARLLSPAIESEKLAEPSLAAQR